MIKEEILELVIDIEEFFNNPFTRKRNILNRDKSDEEVIAAVVNSWYEFLKDEDAETIFKNFKEHVRTNKYPPTIAELLQKEERTGRYIPNDINLDLTAGEKP